MDAFMVSSGGREKAVLLAGGEPAYRMLVEAMNEGAATLSRNGAVLYCNRRLTELLRRRPREIIGIEIQSLMGEAERDRFKKLLSCTRRSAMKGEFALRCKQGGSVSVHLSLNRFRGHGGQALGMVITDLSEQKRKQAAEAKQATEASRMLLERTLSAQEQERRRIARDLHDETGQLLTALLVGLRTLEAPGSLTDVKARGRRLRKIAAQAIEEVGHLARGLHPTVLDDHGLAVAIRRYAKEYEKTHSIAVDLDLRVLDCGLPVAIQTGLYRIFQEALTNVARHSRASSVRVTFACPPHSLQIAIADNGRGFDAGGVSVSSRRLGIQSMRERAAILGGTISFPSQRRGTTVLVQVPLEAAWRRTEPQLESASARAGAPAKRSKRATRTKRGEPLAAST
ncbi:MAG TPA: ATP-binding protein [Terriglobales bacterium]|nr:ATP-binding protein [Terriglobales bacterium]